MELMRPPMNGQGSWEASEQIRVVNKFFIKHFYVMSVEFWISHKNVKTIIVFIARNILLENIKITANKRLMIWSIFPIFSYNNTTKLNFDVVKKRLHICKLFSIEERVYI